MLSDRERELLPAEPAACSPGSRDEDWEVDEAIQPALLALCARYLTTRTTDRVEDPVANFHFANGAALDADQLDGRPEPERSVARRRAHDELPVRTREDRALAPSAMRHHGEVAYSSAIKELLAE